MLTFDNQEQIEKIYKIKTIFNMVFKIKLLRRNSKLILQCKRCQGFNHTRAYCRKEPRCVKCAGKHLTKNCFASRNTSPKCINCKESHLANYRGCEIAKKFQKRRNLLLNSNKQSNCQPKNIKLRNKKEHGRQSNHD